MDDPRDFVLGLFRIQERPELILAEEFRVFSVFENIAGFEVHRVHADDIGKAFLIELPYHHATYKSVCTSYDNHRHNVDNSSRKLKVQSS